MEPYEGEDDAARELRALRDESDQACHAVEDRQDVIIQRLWWIVAEQLTEHGKATTSNEALADLKARLGESLDVDLDGVDAEHPLPVTAQGTVQVSNQPDIAGVQAAVHESSETFDSNAWGIAGLFVGLGALVWLFKLVRP